MYKVTGKIIHNGKKYMPGDDWDATEEQVEHLVNSGMLEVVGEPTEPAKKSKVTKAESTPEPTGKNEKGEPQEVPTKLDNLGKNKLMNLAKEEDIELEETMTPAEMRLAIIKAREERAKQQN